jgi:hypothetical protein
MYSQNKSKDMYTNIAKHSKVNRNIEECGVIQVFQFCVFTMKMLFNLFYR